MSQPTVTPGALASRNIDHPLYDPEDSIAASVSRSTVSALAGRATSTLSSSTSRLRRPQINEEWTLFGELMLNSTSPARPPPPPSSSHHLSPPTTPLPQRIQPFKSPREELESSPFAAIASPELVPSHPTDLVRTFDYNSDSDDDISIIAPISNQQTPSAWPTLSPLWRNITKCVVAYFLASLFTYSPLLSGFLSDITSEGDTPSPAGHMVATVAVYYNPAKTIGSMAEADIFCFGGVLYSAVVSLTSVSLYWVFERIKGWEWLGDVLVLTTISVSMGLIAWSKIRMAKSSFNTACSMMAIMIFIVVVKEGGVSTLLQVIFLVVLGALISNVICLSLWPQSATSRMRNDLVTTLESFSTLLEVLTHTFLLDADVYPKQHKLHSAVSAHQSAFTTLKRDLSESKSEWILSGRHTTAYDDAVISMQRLAQHLGGLRGGTTLQAQIIKGFAARGRSMSQDPTMQGRDSLDERSFSKAAIDAFGQMVDDLGPPVQALSTACSKSLRKMKRFFQQGRTRPADISDFDDLSRRLTRALYTFDSTSNQAILRVYNRSDPFILGLDGVLPSDIEDREEALFLVYFFMFTLQQFAEEVAVLIDAMGRIFAFESIPTHVLWIRKFTSFFEKASVFRFNRSRKSRIRPALKRSLSALIDVESKRDSTYFPNIRPHAPNTVQFPPNSTLSFWGRLKQWFWRLQDFLRAYDKSYAMKAGIATAALAAPAFFDATRPIFTKYRGEWALISFFVVISPTIGATNFLSVHRIAGTLLGAGSALGIYTLFPHDPVMLSLFGAIFSIPCFWIIVSKPTYATTGRFILLTYNLTCLYSYNLREESTTIKEVALRRVVAVTVGVLWALLVSRFWWPSLARRELSKTLSELCANLGWLYTRLVAAYSTPPENINRRTSYRTVDSKHSTLFSPLPYQPGTEQLRKLVHEFQSMELHLQLQLIRTQELLAQAQLEPRLKGPFPVELYRGILTSLQSVLDRLHSMRCVTTQAEWFTTVRHEFILPVNKERREMVGNVLLYFSTLSSAFQLKAPLPPYLPPAERSRKFLVQAIRNLPIVKDHRVETSRHLLYFAYALTMKSVIQELDFLGRTLQDAFGVIGQSRQEFEELFEAEMFTTDENSV